MEKTSKNALSEFSRKAIQRLHDKKIVKHRKLYIPSLDQEITIRNLTYEEVAECTKIDEDNDDNRADRYAIYLAVTEPDLKSSAMQLKDEGEIKEYLEVVDIFEMAEVSDIAMQIMELSGVVGGKKVTVVEEQKN